MSLDKFKLAVVSGQCDVVDDMLESGFVPPSDSIVAVCKLGNVDMLTRLLKYDMDIQTGFLVAVIFGHVELLDYLYVAGANPSYAYTGRSYGFDFHAGNTILHNKVNVSVCKWLLDMGVQQVPNRRGSTPLHLSCLNNDIEFIKLLLTYGVQQIHDQVHDQVHDQSPNQQGRTPLHNACRRGHLSVARVLLAHYLKSPSNSSFRSSFLLESRSVLVDCHLVNAADVNGDTPLHLACGTGHLKMVKLLLNCGAKQVPNNQGLTPMHRACFHDYVKVVKLLLTRGANHCVQDNYGRTPLQLAQKCLAHRTVELLTITNVQDNNRLDLIN